MYDDYDDESDDDEQMPRPVGNVVRKEFFEIISSSKKQVEVPIPDQDQWRLVVTQVISPQTLHAVGLLF